MMIEMNEKLIIYIVYREIPYCGDAVEAIYDNESDAMNHCNKHVRGYFYKEHEVIQHYQNKDLTYTE
jgi:hypothetical protein